jgi:hypothetical protein
MTLETRKQPHEAGIPLKKVNKQSLRMYYYTCKIDLFTAENLGEDE